MQKRFLHKGAIAFLLCLLFTLSVIAQSGNGSLSVTLTLPDGKPVSAATVLIKKLNKTIITDEEGKATFASLPAGNHQLQISFVGYETFEKTIMISANDTTTLNLQLKFTNGQLGVVTVSSLTQTQKVKESAST